jgi:L-alanine-DL-glutamate epimerase-like enolase superfamily enzyme
MTIQQADFYCGGTPAVRERKRKGDLTLICQMLSGCSTTAAAYLAQVLPDWDDGANFLSWFMTWQDEYLKEKETTFQEARVAKQTRLGIVPAA